MNRFVLSVLILFTMIFCGCGRTVCYEMRITVIIKNNSSHKISIDNSMVDLRYWQEPITATLHSGKSFSFSGGEILSIPGTYIGDQCLIVFDDSVRVIHKGYSVSGPVTIEHSICDDESFVWVNTGEYSGTYTYTFTDADYDRAVEWNAKYGAMHAAQ